MNELERNGRTAGEPSCAYFGEGVVFKGSITAPEKVVVHGSVEGEVLRATCLLDPRASSRAR
jgi:hypothetical protein